MMLRPIAFAICITFVFCKSGKFVSINLDAPWNSSPLLLEASEYLAKQSNDLFWKFIDHISDMDHEELELKTDKEMYDLVIAKVSALIPPIHLNLLKLSLSLHVHSPTIAMFAQIVSELDHETQSCVSFIATGGSQSCKISDLEKLVQSSDTKNPVMLIKADHLFPYTNKDSPLVILYAELGTASFKDWHTALRRLASQGKIRYGLRHWISKGSTERLRLSGYGVELAIKSTEYKAKDDSPVEGEVSDKVNGFIFSTLEKLYPHLNQSLQEFREHLLDSEMAPLKAWQMQDLSLQATQSSLSLGSPSLAMEKLQYISQNLPLQARALARVTVPVTLKNEIERNQGWLENHLSLAPGESSMYINGLPVDTDMNDIFSVLGILKSEARLMAGLSALGLEGDSLQKIASLNMHEGDANYALDIRSPAIKYVNNLEKDRRYASWPGSIQDILRPTFPGMMRHLRKNFFSMVFFVDPSKSEELIRMAEAFYVHSAPVRVGLVFICPDSEDQDCVDLARAFYQISADYSVEKALSFVTDVYEKGKQQLVTSEDLRLLFKTKIGTTLSAEDTDDYQAAREYWLASGFSKLPQCLVNGVPMKQDQLSTDEFEEAAVSLIFKLTPEIQKAVYNDLLTESMDVTDYLMTRSNVMPRLNARVLKTENFIIDLIADSDKPDSIVKQLRYMTKKEEETVRALTIWVVADVDHQAGRELLYSAIKYMKISNEVQLSFISSAGKPGVITRAVYTAFRVLKKMELRSFVPKLLKEENVAKLLSGSITLADLASANMDVDGYMKELEAENDLEQHVGWVVRNLEMSEGQRAIVSNARVIGPLDEEEVFTADDWNLLEKYTYKRWAEKIALNVKKIEPKKDRASSLILSISSLLLSLPKSESRRSIEFPYTTYSVMKVPAKDQSQPAYELILITDPASRPAQRLIPLARLIMQVVNTDLQLFFNCKHKHSQLPLTNFYRYVLEPEVQFSADGSLIRGPTSRFDDMPAQPLLTLAMEPPESWLVQSIKSPYDLDNIRLAEVEKGVHADFELEHLLLEGHCFDATSGQPPRGLQFTLGTNSSSSAELVDTIVMANLGYFQLKASPGVWQLNLREGRSSKIYDITSHEFTDSSSNSQQVIAVIENFQSKILKIKVAKKKGMEGEDLLSDSNEDEGGLWSSLSSKFGRGKPASDSQDKTLNIFSVASGHLYERFLRIMMLSVLSNTKTPVKFWFLKNYLSPTFKAFIPLMAKKYGFEFELIQYKWPRWLHQQSEKQRVIWGYKILFLDVLFPLNVEKIIFVDADQIVRTDLLELFNFDLEGAPYGYTPFCSDRREMDGFRFWKSGYWNSHLAGRSYHISALYVVDLKKFRKIAAGDRLRGQYQGLSQDPNSLANLDQDLPNNMIHQVPIKSLPQEWLWCETWCSDESKSKAKTIDLCNNPLTKEPKLSAAVRIVAEWKDLDDEVKQLWDAYLKDRKLTAKTETSKLDAEGATKDDSHIEL